MSTTSKRLRAFTLVELLVAMAVSGILIGITVSTYQLFRKSANLDQSKADLSQNARITLDRMARELRQTPAIVTDMPNDHTDTSVAQPGEIEFEDGHAEDLSYHRYYVSGGILKMDLKEYYFSYNNSVRVKWNSIGNGGVSPVAHTISTQDIADHVQGISFYGTNDVEINIVTTDGGGQTFPLRTVVLGRNL